MSHMFQQVNKQLHSTCWLCLETSSRPPLHQRHQAASTQVGMFWTARHRLLQWQAAAATQRVPTDHKKPEASDGERTLESWLNDKSMMAKSKDWDRNHDRIKNLCLHVFEMDWLSQQLAQLVDAWISWAATISQPEPNLLSFSVGPTTFFSKQYLFKYGMGGNHRISLKPDNYP